MGDIFGYNRSAKPKGVFTTTGSKLNISAGGGSGAGSEGYLVQNWRTNYRQEVREIFEMGSDSLYWAKGRPEGSAEIGRIIGEKDSLTQQHFFPAEAYDICDGGVMVSLTSRGGTCDPGTNLGKTFNKGVKIIMDGVVVSSIGFAMQVQDVQLNEQIAWRFAWMKIEGFQ